MWVGLTTEKRAWSQDFDGVVICNFEYINSKKFYLSAVSGSKYVNNAFHDIFIRQWYGSWIFLRPFETTR